MLPGPTNAMLAMASQGLTARRVIALGQWQCSGRKMTFINDRQKWSCKMLVTVLCAYLAIVLPTSSLQGRTSGHFALFYLDDHTMTPCA
jgi:hypothetical protein